MVLIKLKFSLQFLVLLLSSPKEVTRKGRALRKRGKQSLFCSHKKAQQKMLYHIPFGS